MKHFIGTIKTIAVCTMLATVNPCVLSANEGTPRKTKPVAVADSSAVEIISFSGQSIDKKIDLACKVKSNCCYSIIVERSRNGKEFHSIGTFSDNKVLAEYQLSDETPLRRTNFYRLKIIDNKGSISYSKLMVVQLYNTDVLSMVSVTPNTLLNNLHINVQLKSRAHIAIKITDEKGREIFRKKQSGDEGFNSYELEGTGIMTPGNYSLEVLVNSKDSLTMPLIKS